jgi:hypothetical protein
MTARQVHNPNSSDRKMSESTVLNSRTTDTISGNQSGWHQTNAGQQQERLKYDI